MNAENPAVLFAHPTGNQNSRNALRSLNERNMLAAFWTTICWKTNTPLNNVLSQNLRRRLNRRSYSEVPESLIHNTPWREMQRLLYLSMGIRTPVGTDEKPYSVVGVYRDFDAHVARWLSRHAVDAVYAYEGGALNTFRVAKEKGIPTFYELPSSHWYWNLRLLQGEISRSPEYANLLKILRDSESHLKWKDQELELADHIIVPSSHVRTTLSGVVPEEKIHVVNYGAPVVSVGAAKKNSPGEAIRVLYVGALHQRKGIGYLLQALEQCKVEVDVTLVGMKDAPNAHVDSACKRYRWFESVPHAKVLELMAEADVLIHPSLSEGCALVVLEALANGLPVIVTPNSGTLDFVRDGQEGFVIPICDAQAIADCILQLDTDRELLSRMSLQAQRTATENSWGNYREKWADVIKASLCR
ncbi:glycosyltransferase family 4 protein [Telmatobacter bradus]|uniref:glycosyltransferase family 4 protein n=1 Tax=Telmatobacter bradus TaxID=474953 RepID=UPI003B42C1DC